VNLRASDQLVYSVCKSLQLNRPQKSSLHLGFGGQRAASGDFGSMNLVDVDLKNRPLCQI
jgi:hypothetical protein